MLRKKDQDNNSRVRIGATNLGDQQLKLLLSLSQLFFAGCDDGGVGSCR